MTVTEEEMGCRFDAFLAQRLSEFSRVRLREMIDKGAATVNDQSRKASYRMRVGDRISLVLPAERSAGPIAEDIPLDILFEDEQLAVINKPNGMVVHPAKGHWQGTLTAALAHHLEQLSEIGGQTRPGIVHRLDRDTSGVIVVAKNDAAHLALAKQFEQREVTKEYFAICYGRVDRDRDMIDAPIGAHRHQREKMAIREGHSTSRDASTFYEVDQRIGNFSTLRVFPKTGRTHQIRVHLNHIGHPIVCDVLYTGQRTITERQVQRGTPGGPDLLTRMALHAHRISFEHPKSQQQVAFEAPIPEPLTDFITSLERLTNSRSR